ncbi:outer membrane protein [Terasakiella pusilla]|uniref:outer membrane protein n=1 Tax=Terasakiella pusilla TaxID=64973 RepID=UPI0012EB4EAE|nr:outer membrane beta-barrel protein [Terasakiella pusilla]
MKNIVFTTIMLLSTTAIASDFTGPYVTGAVGYVYGFNNGKEKFASNGQDSASQKMNLTDFNWATSAGYNWEVSDGVLLGGEATFDWMTASDTANQKLNQLYSQQWVVYSDVVYTTSVRAKVGKKVFDDQGLLYISAGPTIAKVKYGFLDLTGPQSEEKSTTHKGVVGAVGLKYKVYDNLSLFSEVSWTKFARESIDAQVWGKIQYQSLSLGGAKIGLSYDF